MEDVRKYFVKDVEDDILVTIEAEITGIVHPISIALDSSDPRDGIQMTIDQAHDLNARLVAAINFVDPGGE